MYFIKNAYKLFHLKNARKYSQQAPTDVIFEYLNGVDKGIAIIGLNRPKQKNALSFNLVKELQESLNKIRQRNEAKVVIVRSHVPGTFCAGADLKERATMPQDQVAKFVSSLRNLMSQIYHLPVPVIAALDGVALGGGLEMALACDIRIAATSAKLGLVETKLAIIPGAGGSQRLPRLINTAIAKELIYTGRILSGEEAHKLGIVNHVVSQSEESNAAYGRSLDLAREILPNGPVALKMAKLAINSGVELSLDEGMEVERSCYAKLIETEDRIEGLKAFQEKRRPNYVGK